MSSPEKHLVQDLSDILGFASRRGDEIIIDGSFWYSQIPDLIRVLQNYEARKSGKGVIRVGEDSER